jgi:diacylglycerol kinase (ATP)
MEAFLNKVINGKTVKLDRWTINQTHRATNNEKDTSSEKKLPLEVLNNYFSIGADAKIALDFHQARQKNPELFTSQAFNKIEYVKNYSKDLLNLSCKNIIENIKVFECDGKNYLDKLKELNVHSIVVLNIPSYASGKKPWKNENMEGYGRQSYSDGKLEIVGFHTADFMFLQLGGHGDSIAQATRLRIVTECPLPMQVDGEPVMLQSSEIIIDKKNQALMVSSDEDASIATIGALASFSCLNFCRNRKRRSSETSDSDTNETKNVG